MVLIVNGNQKILFPLFSVLKLVCQETLSQEIFTSIVLTSQAVVPRLIPPLNKGAIDFSEQLVYLNPQSLKATSNYQKSPIAFSKKP
jgi:hypothetical protein